MKTSREEIYTKRTREEVDARIMLVGGDRRSVKAMSKDDISGGNMSE
jgi:hypothetical protein